MNKKLLIILNDEYSNENNAKNIAEEVLMISGGNTVEYCYSKNCSFYKFETKEDLNILNECFDLMLKDNYIPYVLLYDNDRNNLKNLQTNEWSVIIDNEGENGYLHSQFYNSSDSKSNQDETPNNIPSRGFLFNPFEFVDEEEDDIFIKLRNQPKEKTIDEILDKITTQGIKSLTNEEVNILNKKSKNR